MQVIGLGTLVMMPVIGNLSDRYGRKALLTLPLTVSIIPLGSYTLKHHSVLYFYYYFWITDLLDYVCSNIGI